MSLGVLFEFCFMVLSVIKFLVTLLTVIFLCSLVLIDPLLIFGFVYVLSFPYSYLILHPVVLVMLCYFMFDLMTQ